MSLATYSDLQTSIASWLQRTTDTVITPVIPDFITLFEAEANRRLRTRAQETKATLTPSSGVASLPADYLAWRHVTWTGSPSQELEYMHPAIMSATFPTNDTGVPHYFTIEGTTLTVRASSDTALSFDYFQKIPALSVSNTTNWLLTAYPDVYLFGSLAEAQGFIKDADTLTLWGSRRDASFDAIKKADERSRGVGPIRVMSPCP